MLFKVFKSKFLQQHGIELDFDQEAFEQLCVQAKNSRQSISFICNEIFQSLEHGLNLVKQNTGQKKFAFTNEVLKDPKAALEQWIKQSYN